MSTTEERKLNQDKQQRKAFARWTATHLAKSTTLPEQYQDLSNQLEDHITTWFTDGILLCELAQLLTSIRVKYSAKVTTELLQQSNLGHAMEIFLKDGCELVNIHPTTLNRGDEKATLGLLWQLIQHYTIASKFDLGDDATTGTAAATTTDNNGDDAEEVVAVKVQNDAIATPKKAQVKPTTGTGILRSPTKVVPKRRSNQTISMVDVKNHIIQFVNEQISTLDEDVKNTILTNTKNSNLVCTNLDKEWQTPGLLIALIVALYGTKDEKKELAQKLSTTTEENNNNNNEEDQQALIATQFETAMSFAKDNMDIPKLMDGHDIVESIDVNTNVTYLSYYLAYQYKPKPVVAPTPVPAPVAVVEPVVEEKKQEEEKKQPEEEKKSVDTPTDDGDNRQVTAQPETPAAVVVEDNTEKQQEEAPKQEENQTTTTNTDNKPSTSLPQDELQYLVEESAILNTKTEQEKVDALQKLLSTLQQHQTQISSTTAQNSEEDVSAQAIAQQKARNATHIARLQAVLALLQQQQQQQQQNKKDQDVATTPQTPALQNVDAAALKQQQDLTMYLAIALVVAIIACLLK